MKNTQNKHAIRSALIINQFSYAGTSSIIARTAHAHHDHYIIILWPNQVHFENCCLYFTLFMEQSVSLFFLINAQCMFCMCNQFQRVFIFNSFSKLCYVCLDAQSRKKNAASGYFCEPKIREQLLRCCAFYYYSVGGRHQRKHFEQNSNFCWNQSYYQVVICI